MPESKPAYSSLLIDTENCFPATNRKIVGRDMITSRFEDGKVAEDWMVTDLAEHLLLARKG